MHDCEVEAVSMVRSSSQNLLLVMVVMSLRRREEGEVVAAVGDCGAQDGHIVPKPGDGQVGAHHSRPQPDR